MESRLIRESADLHGVHRPIARQALRPVSAPKQRTWPDRRPDIDKLVRSTLDALTTAEADTVLWSSLSKVDKIGLSGW